MSQKFFNEALFCDNVCRPGRKHEESKHSATLTERSKLYRLQYSLFTT